MSLAKVVSARDKDKSETRWYLKGIGGQASIDWINIQNLGKKQSSCCTLSASGLRTCNSKCAVGIDA